MTPVCCGSLASVRSPKRAYPYRVSGFIVHVTALLFFWLKSASTSLRACCQPFDCPCRSDLVVVDCTIGPPIELALQPARVASCPVAETQVVKTHHDQSPLSVIAGRAFAERQAPLKVSGQNLLVMAPTSSSTYVRYSWLCTSCVTEKLSSLDPISLARAHRGFTTLPQGS